jgi:hypothetical protein
VTRQWDWAPVGFSLGAGHFPHPPEIIPAKGTVNVEVIVRPPDHVGQFETQAIFTTDAPMLPPLTLHAMTIIQ